MQTRAQAQRRRASQAKVRTSQAKARTRQAGRQTKGWKGQAEKGWKGQTGSSGWGTEMERTGQTGGMHGIGFYRGAPFATVNLVGESGPLPDWEPYQSRFRPLRQDRSTRLTAEYRNWGYRLDGFCLAPCSLCSQWSCSRPVTTDSETSHARHVCGGCYRPAWEASQSEPCTVVPPLQSVLQAPCVRLDRQLVKLALPGSMATPAAASRKTATSKTGSMAAQYRKAAKPDRLASQSCRHASFCLGPAAKSR